MTQFIVLCGTVLSWAVALPVDNPVHVPLPSGVGDGPRWRLPADQAVPDTADAAADLLRHAEAADTALEEFDRRLLAANWIMARQLAPMASRLLLGIPEKGDSAAARGAVLAANTQLERALNIWTEVVHKEKLAEEQRWRRADNLDGLRAFAAAFAAVWPPPSESDEQRDVALRRAASDLAMVLEDDRADVASAATLWQAYLYGCRDRRNRAMDLLPMALEPPKARGRSGLYARLLRCRFIVLVHDSYAVPVALLARLEERCADWFDDVTEQRRAQRTAALVRRQILGQWARKLREANKPDRAAWCATSIARIDETYFDGDEPANLLGLEFAAPPIVDLKNAAKSLEALQHHPQSDPKPTAEQSPEADPPPAPPTPPGR